VSEQIDRELRAEKESSFLEEAALGEDLDKSGRRVYNGSTIEES